MRNIIVSRKPDPRILQMIRVRYIVSDAMIAADLREVQRIESALRRRSTFACCGPEYRAGSPSHVAEIQSAAAALDALGAAATRSGADNRRDG
jgi:hypothetical protein